MTSIRIAVLSASFMLGCHRQTEPRGAVPAPPPVAPPAGARTPAVLATGPAPGVESSAEAASPAESAADAGSCEPEVAMNEKPGAHDRYRFEAADGRFGFRDAHNQVVIEPRFRFAYEFSAGGVAPVVEEKRFAFIDSTGRVIAEAFPYDNGPDYFVEGRARIVRNGQVGFIDRQGAVVVAPRWDFASPFCEGRAVVCRGCGTRWQRGQKTFGGGRWGYIDGQGKLVIPLELDAAEPFQDGTALVVKHGRKTRIDHSGKVVQIPDGG